MKMKGKDTLISILITIVLSVLVFFMGANEETLAAPTSVYQVYLNGTTIGYLNSRDKFLDLVNQKQEEIKKKYGVDKVYPPSGLKIEKISTYDEEIKTAEQIYNIIENTEPFTIDGYIITIRYTEENKAPVYIYTLRKEDFQTAFYNTVAAFVGTEKLNAYKNNKQELISDTGSKIDNIYWDEKISVKEAYISVKENIFTNDSDLSKYLLFGTTEEQKQYTVGENDSIDDIIDKNNLSIEEFLIANPSIPNQNALLTKGQQVSIGLISPIVNIVHEEEVVENITNKFKTEYQNDDTMYKGESKVLQEGSNGTLKITESILYRNGAIENLVITKKEEIAPAVNKIVARGTKSYSSGGTYINTGTEDWYWPTVSPYVITSGFKWRWGKHHNGIDISGSGFGSPIYSSTDGTVTVTYSSCPNRGYYGSSCGQSWGNYIRILTDDGAYTVIYAHIIADIKVKPGDHVTRGQHIGYMGDSGSSTGTHLHFGIINNSTGSYLNPCGALSC